MNPVVASQADVVGWISLVIGTAVLAGGVFVGLWTALRRTPQEASTKIDDAKARLGEARAHIERTKTAVSGSHGEAVGAAEATNAAEAAQESTAAAGTALDQVE